MKKCPTCEKSYDDALRFCQADGTPLVAAVEPIDPYKTMVARPEEIAQQKGAGNLAPESKWATDAGEVLEIPPKQIDPKKTMHASEEEIRQAMSEAEAAENIVMDLPPLVEPKPPEFIEPTLPKREPQFSAPSPAEIPMTPPIPSPFTKPPVEQKPFEPPAPDPPAFVAAEVKEPTGSPKPDPFDRTFASQMPRAAVDPVSVSPQIPKAQSEVNMQNTPPDAKSGQNKVLPIVSLVFGVLSLCCGIAPLTGLIAIVTGFLGMRNANNDPINYGGKGLAIAGMILGALFFVVGIAYWIFIIFLNGMDLMMRMVQ
ncbi:MAG: hypothetical protein C4324_10580 [Blastocatellia bacterium]